MKAIIGTFFPFIIFTIITAVLFYFLKEDGSVKTSRTHYTNYAPDCNEKPKIKKIIRVNKVEKVDNVKSNVQDIFEEVEVKKVRRDRVRYASEVTAVRWSQHDGYERLVFDIDGFTEGSFQIGQDVNDKRILHGSLSGYKAFSAVLPSFNSSSILDSMDVVAVGKDTYNFVLKLQRPASFKTFVLRNPTRIVIDFY